MAENNHNHPSGFSFPPFGPPPHGGYPTGPPPAFWDFINSMTDPSRNGAGVDHTANPDHGVEFGPDGFNAWSGPHGFSGAWGRRGRGGPRGFGPTGGRRGHGAHRRHLHHHPHLSPFDSLNNEDLNDITAAAAAAEAEMEAARDNEREGTPNTTMRDAGDEHPDPPEEVPPVGQQQQQEGEEGRRCRGGCRGGFRGFGRGRGRGRGRGGPFGFGGPLPFGGPPFGGPPPPPPFDFDGLMDYCFSDPFVQRLREQIQRITDLAQQQGTAEGGERAEDSNSFTPPVDVFDTTNNWTIHVAVPGAKKEDVGVNWDAGKSTLTVSGVVHRPGDEEFLRSMISGERRVGLFERKIKLPPVHQEEGKEEEEESKDEVDGDHITAKMEDGILVVIVPKVEKEWTEIKKVDIL